MTLVHLGSHTSFHPNAVYWATVLEIKQEYYRSNTRLFAFRPKRFRGCVSNFHILSLRRENGASLKNHGHVTPLTHMT